jgi:hypothetical protein
MPSSALNLSYGNHRICVVKTQWGTARLYVDDELLDTTNDLYASDAEARLVGVFGEKDECIEVFIQPLKTGEVAIRVNGEWISGDQAYAAASD